MMPLQALVVYKLPFDFMRANTKGQLVPCPDGCFDAMLSLMTTADARAAGMDGCSYSLQYLTCCANITTCERFTLTVSLPMYDGV